MSTITDNYRIKGTAREAGRNVLHTVTLDGERVASRRSAHRYAFAIAYWSRHDGTAKLIVHRWSSSPKCSGESFAIRIEDAPAPAPRTRCSCGHPDPYHC